MVPLITLKLLCIIKSSRFQYTLDPFDNINYALATYIIYRLSAIIFLSCSYLSYFYESSIIYLTVIYAWFLFLLYYFTIFCSCEVFMCACGLSLHATRNLYIGTSEHICGGLRVISIINVNLPFLLFIEAESP